MGRSGGRRLRCHPVELAPYAVTAPRFRSLRARLTQKQPIHTLSLEGQARPLRVKNQISSKLVFEPIPKPAMNDLPLLVVNRTEIEKARPFFL
jgi:hypothetical protein